MSLWAPDTASPAGPRGGEWALWGCAMSISHGAVPLRFSAVTTSCSGHQENIISPVEDSPIPEIAGKDSGADGAGTSPRSQNKPFR